MTHQDLASKLQSFDSTRLVTWLAWIISIAVGFLIAIFYAYFHKFSDLGLSNDQAIWGQFGDFIGGTINPILSFLSLIALILTIALQNRQINIAQAELENSRSELNATREELEKSANAQQQTALALKEQAKHAIISAKLSALRAALDVTSESINQQRELGPIPTNHEMRVALIKKKEQIATEILKITDELCN